MKFIYAICLLVLLPATAAAAEPKWSFKKAGGRSTPWDQATVSWPNPQYRGELKISVACTETGSNGILMQFETGEYMAGKYATIQVPLRFDGKNQSVAAMIADTGFFVSDYDAKFTFFNALLSPTFTISVSDSNGRPVVSTPVPHEGAEAAFRKLSCLSRFFYEYDQRPKEEPEPEAPVVPEAPAAPANRCGDGFIQEGEVCDDGNQAGNDGCEPDCTVPVRRPSSTP